MRAWSGTSSAIRINMRRAISLSLKAACPGLLSVFRAFAWSDLAHTSRKRPRPGRSLAVFADIPCSRCRRACGLALAKDRGALRASLSFRWLSASGMIAVFFNHDAAVDYWRRRHVVWLVSKHANLARRSSLFLDWAADRRVAPRRPCPGLPVRGRSSLCESDRPRLRCC